MIITGRLDYVQSKELRETWQLAQDVGRLLNGLLRALEEKPENNKPSPRR
jgi:hypothetical protein